jgi:anti-anti-sigma factor
MRVTARQTGNSCQMKPATSSLSDTIVVAPEGEVDIARLDEFRDALYDAARQAQQLLVVDLSHVESIDSSGRGALIELHHRLGREQRQLAVVAPGGTAAALILNLTGLQNRLPTYKRGKPRPTIPPGPHATPHAGIRRDRAPCSRRGSPRRSRCSNRRTSTYRARAGRRFVLVAAPMWGTSGRVQQLPAGD